MDGGVREERALMRIAAVLVTLSMLAERAADRAFPVRILALVVLRWAEAVARAFVEEVTATDWSCLDDTAETGAGPLAATRLAVRFRLLAAALDLYCAARRSAWPRPGLGACAEAHRRCAADRFAVLSPRLSARWRPLACDTS